MSLAKKEHLRIANLTSGKEQETAVALEPMNEEQVKDMIRAAVWEKAAVLDALSVDHLDDEQTIIFEGAIKAAKNWLREMRHKPGLSFVLSGGFGVGKSTIIEALAAATVQAFIYYDDNDNIVTYEGSPSFNLVKRSLFLKSTDALAMVKEAAAKDSLAVRIGGRDRYWAVFIDDVGRGVMPYVSKDDFEAERAARYSALIDHCYDEGISVVITTNEPLIAPNGGFSQNLARIIGAAAWDRLLEIAPAGYMYHLGGIPSMRAALGGRKLKV